MAGFGSRAVALIDELLSDLDDHPQSWVCADNANHIPKPNKPISKSREKKLAKQQKKLEKKQAKLAKQNASANANQTKSKRQQKKERKKGQACVSQEKARFVSGSKSSLMAPIASHYSPWHVESLWDEWWERQGFYKGLNKLEEQEKEKDKFVMMIPPPNVTGRLHLGHALMCTIEDAITRYWRMRGYNCLWLPGTDHAGIATQTAVERRLIKSFGKSRLDYGREEFLAKVWEWKESNGNSICNQIRKMGCSVDWSRFVFTMDDKLSIAVTEAFVRMYEKGLIFRGNRLCNWSMALQSAISNAEVDTIELVKETYMEVPGYKNKILFGILDYFDYPLCNENGDGPCPSGKCVTIATTRLETMLGDTGVAVHSQDARYFALHGSFVWHPFLRKKIRIIKDDILVKRDFGTGVVKVTPAHDENDFQCGKRQKLEFVNILTNDGKINESVLPHGKEFVGLARFDCRRLIRERLKEMGLYREQKCNPMSIAVCSRSHDIIEPMLKAQWYVDCQDMAKKALKVVDSGELQLYPPKEGKREWHNFLDNIRDWCISRQLWWGHRIPAWLICVNGKALDSRQSENWIIARTEKEAYDMLLDKHSKHSKHSDDTNDEYTLSRDPDVLDTWFSSGLFPFSTLGWPDESSLDLKSFFPGTLLETGSDILFFWVARMVMMSLELMHDQLPFKHVFLHPMVRDKHGKKMSKTKGNVIDPLHIINGVSLETLINELKIGNIKESEVNKYSKMKKQEFPNGIRECGADALRFGLLTYLAQGRSINLDVQRIIGYRQFCNKIWNATKFSLSNFQMINIKFDAKFDISDKCDSISNQWILSRLYHCILTCYKHNESYDFAVSTNAIYQFFLHEFCDVYLELTKPIFYHNDDNNKNKNMNKNMNKKNDDTGITAQVLFLSLENSLRLLHPFMPFLTEELWQRLQREYVIKAESKSESQAQSIMVEPFPNPADFARYQNKDAENDMTLIQDIASTVRASKQGLFGLRSLESYPVRMTIEEKKDSNADSKGSDPQTVRDKLNQYKLEICTLSNLNEDEVSVVARESETKDDGSGEWYPINVESTHPIYKDCIEIVLASKVGSIVNWQKRIEHFSKLLPKLQKQIQKDKSTIANIANASVKQKTEKALDFRLEELRKLQTKLSKLKSMKG